MTDPRHRRRDALRHLFHRDHIRTSAKLSRQPALPLSILAGFQAGLTTVIALTATLLSPYADLLGFAALGALVALFGRFAPLGKRNLVVAECGLWQSFAVLLMSAATCLGTPVELRLVLLTLLCGWFFLLSTSRNYGPPGALIFVFAAGAAMSDASSWLIVAERTLATSLAALLALAICALTDQWRGTERLSTLAPPAIPPLNQRLVSSFRIVLAAMTAIFVSQAFGADHPVWAAMGVLAVMQGQHLHLNLVRSLQRVIGTVLGACLAWFILKQDPSVWAIVPLLFILQMLAELIIGANYGLGQVMVTPMALLMTHIAAPQFGGPMIASERILDTILGALIGLAVAVLLSTNADRRFLAEHSYNMSS